MLQVFVEAGLTDLRSGSRGFCWPRRSGKRDGRAGGCALPAASAGERRALPPLSALLPAPLPWRFCALLPLSVGGWGSISAQIEAGEQTTTDTLCERKPPYRRTVKGEVERVRTGARLGRGLHVC